MSRVTTSNLSLGAWDEGDNPGAGSKTVASGNTGLNGNWLILDAAVGVGHNADGTHKADTIDGPNLKTSVADASTIQLTGSPLKLNIKDDGVTGAKIAAAFADGSTLETSAATGSKTIRIKDAGVTKSKLASTVADGTTIELDATDGLRIKADGVTAAKMAHDNPRLRESFTFAFAQGDSYGKYGGVTCGATFGIPMRHAGMIVEMLYRTSDGDTGSDSQSYASSGAASTGRVAAGDPLSCAWGEARIAGTAVTALDFGGSVTAIGDSGYGFLTIVVEFDD